MPVAERGECAMDTQLVELDLADWTAAKPNDA